MRPGSNRTRSTAGPFAKAAAIVLGAVGVLVSRMTLPSRSTTQTCVSSIETSNPAKYSIAALLFISESRSYRLSGSSRPLPDVEKLDFLPRSQFLRQQAGFKKKALRVSAERLIFRCAAAVANWRRQRVALSALHDQIPIF